MPTKSVLTALIAFALVSLSACGGGGDDDEDFPGIAAMCRSEDGVGCDCTGFLITPQTVVSAAHCGRVPWVIFGRTDPTDTSSGVAIRIDSRCGGLTGYETCDRLASTDLELHFLRDPVPASVTPPVRLGTNADRDGADSLLGAGYGKGNLRGETFPVPPVMCTRRVNDGFPGQNFCFNFGGDLVTTGILTNGDSGGPLYASTSDGELSVVGMYQGFLAGFEVYQDLEAHADLLPGTRRPPLTFPNLNELHPWHRQCETPILVPLDLIVQTSLQVADFNADGVDDVFFEVEQDTPRLLLGPVFGEMKTSEVADEALYPYTMASGRWTQTEGLAAVDKRLRLRTFELEGTQWTPTPLPPVDLLQHDPMWNGADLDELDQGQPNLVTDPLLRPGDLDGDGRTDILAVLSERLVTFVNGGDAWTIFSQPLADLSIPNEQAYRETITVADVAAGVAGAEVVARYECGLIVFGYEANDGLFEIYRQTCGNDPWVASDEQGYNDHNRWRIATGNLDGDACADVMLRSPTRVHQLFSNCDPVLPLAFSEGPNPGAAWLEPFGGYTGWGAGDFGGRMLLIDLDGDGLDDLIGNGPDGMQGRGNKNAEQSDLAFGSIGGLDSAVTGAANSLLPIEDWRLIKPGNFGANGRQLISLSRSLGCLELIGL